MPENNDIITFERGGLNSDDDLLFIPKEDARFRQNVVRSDDYNFRILTNVLGNTLKNNSGGFSYPSGNLRVIGFVENKEEQAAIFFIYSDAGEHSIVQYYSDTDTLKYILDGGSAGVGSILNFQEDKYIDAGIIGNEDDKYLVFTDNYNDTRILNIIRAINYTASSGSPAYSSISNELLTFYKKPYLGYVRVFGSSYDSGFNGDNISQKIFQFSIRLRYYDRTYSPLSPYSNFLYTIDEIPSGRLSDEIANNRIIIQLNFDNDTTLVESYQLLFRNIDIGSGVAGNWYIYDNYDYTSTGMKSIDFYNDKNIGIISTEETLRYYDYIPQLAEHVGIIDSNRVVLGGAKEGYPNVDYGNSSEWDVTLAATEVSISSIYEGIQYEHNDIIDNGGSNPTSIVFNYTEATSTDNFYSLYILESPSITSESTIIQSSFGVTHTSIYSELATWVNGLSYDLTAVAGATLTISINGGSANIYGIYLIVLSVAPIWNTLKTGATYKYGLLYHFNGRLGFVQTSDDLIEDTPNYGDITSTYTNYYLRADLTIDHIAPTGATHYQVVSFGSNIDYFEQYAVRYNPSDKTDSTANYTLYYDDYNTIIKRDDMLNNFNDAYNGSVDYGMDIEAGDIIRFIGEFDSISGSGVTQYDVQLFNTNYEYIISSVSTTEIKCSYSALANISTTSGYVLIEIVRFKKQIDYIAQEFSEVYSIDSNGYHSANFQQQTGAQPAIVQVTEDFTDCWKSKQIFSKLGIGGGRYAWMEKPKVSLYYDSYPSNFGRFNTVNENAATRTLNKIRWGGKFLDDSGYNFMSVFDGVDEKILDDRNGMINKIQQIGDTLKVYQERMTNSFYLKTTSSTSADGSQTYVFSDNVMSDARQSVFEYGCTHFTSYTKTTRAAYYFDIINGVVIKDTPGGPVEISEQNMHTYFKNKSIDILNYGIDSILVLGGYDEDLDMYLLTFLDPSTPAASINETIGYYIPEERWIAFYSYLPEYYGKISGNTALTFKNGQLYLQNSNTTRNNFFGVQYESIIDVHANSYPNEIKVYESMNNVGSGRWAPSTDGDIEITLPELMQSRLVEGKFKLQEGVYTSEFLRDALVKDGIGGTTFEKSQLIGGRFLRGHEMRIRLRNDDTDEANLRIVTVKSNISQ